MCELCDKQVAAFINNRNADIILKMSQAVDNLYQSNYQAEAKKVADALVKLLPQEAKTSGDTNGQAGPGNQATDNGPNPHYKGDPKKVEPSAFAYVDDLIKSMGINPANVFIVRTPLQ